VALVVLALVAAVAIASTGSVPQGAPGVRRPSEQLLDVTMSLLAVFVLVGGVLALGVFALLRRDEAVASAARGGRKRGLSSALVSAAFGLVLVLAALRFVRSDDARDPGDGQLPSIGDAAGLGEVASDRYEPQFTPWPVIVTVALVAIAAVAIGLERRARRRAAGPAPPPAAVETALADVLDETLDDLRAERDPRTAVIAAYARMERALAAARLPRREAEAPEEYLTRVVDGVDLGRRNAGRLTALFAWARFSGHDVRPEMKDDAIDTLEAVRDELRAAAARREALDAARAAEALA
jgi:NADH:ubiquinone oxidoreductase subunit 6 (subunit J)